MSRGAIEIRVDEAQLREIERILAAVPRALPKIVSRALNKVAVSARAELVRNVAKELSVNQKTARRHTFIKRASYRFWQALLRIGAGWIPLPAWKPRWRWKWEGARSRLPGQFKPQVMLGRPIKLGTMAGTFMARRQVFIRAPGAKRLKILKVYGPSILEAYDKAPALARALLERAGANLEKEVDRQVQVILERGR